MNLKHISALFLCTGISISLLHGQAANKPTVKKQQPAKSQSVKKTVAKPAAGPVKSITLKNAQDSLSYALGVDVAKSLKSSGFDLNLNILFEGLGTSYDGKPVLFDEQRNSEIIQESFRQVMEKKNAALKKPGEDYLASLKSNPKIQSTAEGVLYEVITQVEGNKPSSTDEVKVHYAGSLIDGVQFDSSYDRGQPINLRLNQVIEGWKIGIPLMSVGSKYRFYIPYHLGYGERGSGKIPPFSPLIFDVELLEIIAPNAVQ